jgi:drug/metabolite transporter (DMT)-like permease
LRRPRVVATLLLVGVTAIWGFTFVPVKQSIAEIPTFQFLGMRFMLATLLLFALFLRKADNISVSALKAGTIAGLALAAGYAFQTLGLRLTGATKAGFITGLAVVFTPAIAAIVLRKAPGARALAGVAISVLGLILLTVGGAFALNVGDSIVLLCAISFAVHIVILGQFSPKFDAPTLTISQLGTAGILFSLISAATETIEAPDESVWLALITTAVGASAAAFLIQTWAQRHLTPTTTAVTFTMEPVFAGLAGFILLDERLSARNWIGAALILLAMLLVSARSAET